MHGAHVQRLVEWARVLVFAYVMVQNVAVSSQLKRHHVNYKTAYVSRHSIRLGFEQAVLPCLSKQAKIISFINSLQPQSRPRARSRLFSRSPERWMAEDQIFHGGHSRRFPNLRVGHTRRYFDLFLSPLSRNTAV